MFRPTISAIIRRYYNNVEGKSDEAASIYNVIKNWNIHIYTNK